MDNQVLQAIARRRSVREYQEKPVPRDALEAIVTAGLSAPCAGDQLCHISAVRDGQVIGRMNEAAKAVGASSGMEHLRVLGASPAFHSLYGAPALLVVSAAERAVAPQMDSAAAAQNMLLAAVSLGLGACWVYYILMAFEGPDGEAFRAELSIPKSHNPLVAIALGYPAETLEFAPKRRGSASYIG